MRHILIAEDQPSGRFVLSYALKEKGYKVTVAENGKEAILKFRELFDSDAPVDMLVTDIEMPEITGVELIDAVRSDSEDLPVLVMTAHGSKHLVVDLMRKGIDDYIDKPFEPDDLLEMIEKIFAKEDMKKEERKRQQAIQENEKARLRTQVDSFREQTEKLRREIENAKIAYDDLVKIDTDNLAANIAYRQRPLSDLGGDFIGVMNVENGLDILIADVAGHDMAASFHTILIKTLFEENSELQAPGSEFFKKLNTILYDNGKNERMVTALHIRVNLKDHIVQAVSAGHPYPIRIEKKFPVPRPVLVRGNVLGIYDDIFFETHTFDMLSGMRLFLYTDGLIDVVRHDGKTGKKERLTADRVDEFIKEFNDRPLDETIEAIWGSVLAFSNYKYRDDMTILAVEIP